jgi:hypothetical protein
MLHKVRESTLVYNLQDRPIVENKSGSKLLPIREPASMMINNLRLISSGAGNQVIRHYPRLVRCVLSASAQAHLTVKLWSVKQGIYQPHTPGAGLGARSDCRAVQQSMAETDLRTRKISFHRFW